MPPTGSAPTWAIASNVVEQPRDDDTGNEAPEGSPEPGSLNSGECHEDGDQWPQRQSFSGGFVGLYEECSGEGITKFPELDELATRTYKLDDVNTGHTDMRDGHLLRRRDPIW